CLYPTRLMTPSPVLNCSCALMRPNSQEQHSKRLRTSRPKP
ncbi:MAG: hypothetical protein AVDCRST_MAG93-7197, partial [uncultured Chloroflexia bacterium]